MATVPLMSSSLIAWRYGSNLMMPRPGGRSPWTLPSQSLMWTWMALPLSSARSIGLVSASTRWLMSILARTRGWVHSSTKRTMAVTLLIRLSRKGSSFRSRQSVDRSAWKIKPAAYCDEQHIIQFWDDILRFIATIKLKETTASDIFRRLNSYSKQHGLYHALKAFGQILKSIFILRVIDEPGLRMSIEKVLSGIEHVHAFTRAVSVGNPREFLQAEKEDQEMAEACKRLIKNCIICWNYLYLSQKLAEIDDPAKREQLLQAMAHGSAAAWGHLNLLGEYDFSEDKLQDSVGIKLPKLTD